MAKTLRSQLKGSQFDQGLVDVFGPAETIRGRKKQTFGINWVMRDDWLVNLSPVSLVDELCDELLRAHRDAIRKGVRADNDAPQKRLVRRGKTADPTRSGETRGFRDGDFSDTIARGKISESGPKISQKTGKMTGPRLSTRTRPFATRARATIGATSQGRQADRLGNAGQYVFFVSEEETRGVEYFFVEGKMSKLIGDVVDRWMDGAVQGVAPRPTSGDVSALEASRD